jgi:hypothetical protein
MAALKAKILSIDVRQNGEEAEVVFRFGTKEMIKPLPSGHGFVRGSAILDNDGNLVDCELITEKI